MTNPRALRVLVADDNHDTVLTLTMLLREEGHEVEGVYSAADVILAVRRMRPDVIILDIEMPLMSGYAVAREIRNIFGERSPMLIAISGKWTMPSDRRLAEELGFDHHLAKPADPKTLFSLLSRPGL
jgi:CheY-like chemotaxis protein